MSYPHHQFLCSIDGVMVNIDSPYIAWAALVFPLPAPPYNTATNRNLSSGICSRLMSACTALHHCIALDATCGIPCLREDNDCPSFDASMKSNKSFRCPWCFLLPHSTTSAPGSRFAMSMQYSAACSAVPLLSSICTVSSSNILDLIVLSVSWSLSSIYPCQCLCPVFGHSSG